MQSVTEEYRDSDSPAPQCCPSSPWPRDPPGRRGRNLSVCRIARRSSQLPGIWALSGRWRLPTQNHCTGHGSPTVVLEAGLSDVSVDVEATTDSILCSEKSGGKWGTLLICPDMEQQRAVLLGLVKRSPVSIAGSAIGPDAASTGLLSAARTIAFCKFPMGKRSINPVENLQLWN